MASATLTVSNMFVKMAVPDSGCTIESIQLIKFDYNIATTGGFDYIDYLHPEDGTVNRYGYNETENSFGEEVNSTWVSVDAMNSYDPVERIISTLPFKDMNYNAIYEIAFSSSGMASRYMQLYANRLTDKTKQSGEIYLTDCVDFDVFTEGDLDDDNPLFVNPLDAEDTKMYYPSYFEDKSRVLSANEKIFYKVSYLSSLKATHPHFYDTNPKPTSITVGDNVPSTFDDNAPTKFYINVNYAPSKADPFMKDISLSNILAVYDYSFSFLFTEEELS